VEKLGFQWDEVHDMAEELEHIKSDLLTDRLDVFLDCPRFDPHGDPIPDKSGNIAYHEDVTLDSMPVGQKGIIVGVVDHTPEFLQYLEKNKLVINATITILQAEDYDKSKALLVNGSFNIVVSQKVATNLLVRKLR
jgi:DtxR family Mn-dependent transcriptional regulator